MATHILGISAFYHDSAAALLRDGVIVAAAQEERFTRNKHDSSFPEHAVAYCLSEAGIDAADLDDVVFYDKPVLKFTRLLETYLATVPRGLGSFFEAIPTWLKSKLWLPKVIDKGLGGSYEGPIHFTGHHESHAASAFFPSPFEEAAVITCDGVGEWSTTTWGVGAKNSVELRQEVRFPHSLGLLYSAITYYTGFRVNSGEYKVMGLAPYGAPKYVNLIFDHLMDLKEDGSFQLDQNYFNYCAGLTMTNSRFHDLFGGPPRTPESELSQKEMDIAASVQRVTEEVMLRLARHAHRESGSTNLCLAGGVALNSVANGRVLREGPFENIWIQPAAGDAGGCLGAALLGWHHIHDQPRVPVPLDAQSGSLLGPAFSSQECRRALDEYGARFTHIDDEGVLCARIAQLLDEGKVVGHFNGRMEFGPRALGNRSILGDPRNPETQTVMNLKIKFRESFRPFAPSVLVEDVSQYFDLGCDSPYMLLVAPVLESRRKEENTDESLFGIDRLRAVRSDLPSITHVDYSARVQTVDATRNPRYHRLISAFKERTGCAVVVNTSFNIRGEPLVCTPEDAYRCFMFTDMDALVVNNYFCLKSEQVKLDGADEYKRQFNLD